MTHMLITRMLTAVVLMTTAVSILAQETFCIKRKGPDFKFFVITVR